MPYDVWSYTKRPHIIVHQGACVIDPGFWTYTPPERAVRLGSHAFAV